MQRPQESEYAPFYHGYVSLVPEVDILSALDRQVASLTALHSRVPPDKETFAYAPGKWSVRQVVGHLGDGERVFGYRALRFSRSDTTALPGFDENVYVENATFDVTPIGDLIDELVLLRQANLRMLRSIPEARWSSSGLANGKAITVRALAFVMVGHVRHHLALLRDRYGIPTASEPGQ